MHRTRRLATLLASLAMVTLPSSASADQAYSNGLHPGSTLAGRTLPIDWSTRRTPCDGPTFLRRQGDLCPGDSSWAVFSLQWLMAERKLYRGEFTGVYDEKTRYAVFTFHKLTGPAHTDPATARSEWIANPPPDDWVAEDWEMLRAFVPRPPTQRDDQPDRIEVDIGHQVLYLIEDHDVSAIIPVSSGQGRGERGCVPFGCGALVTPRTELLPEGATFYTEHRYAGGWGGTYGIYKAIFYRGQYGEWYYAIHGYREVPNYPASRGCIRVTTWDMDFLRPWAPDGTYDVDAARVKVGMVIHVWDEIEIEYSVPTDGLH